MNYIRSRLLVLLVIIPAILPVKDAYADQDSNAIIAGIGAFALGAIAGSSLAYHDHHPPIHHHYHPDPYEPAYPHCWFERRPLFDEDGDIVGYQPPYRLCE